MSASAQANTTLISAVSGTTNVGGDQSSGSSSAITPDGRYVAFESAATNLVSGDTTGPIDMDVFVRDTITSETKAVSNLGCFTGAINCNSLSASISDDGRYVAFQSLDNTLVANDTNVIWDIFVRDMNTGSVIRVSVDSAGNQANGGSTYPHISGDGQWVMFESAAPNLVGNDTNGATDIFVQHLNLASFQTGSTTVASAVDGSNPPVPGTGTNGYASSYLPASRLISREGRYVVFTSSFTDLVLPPVTDGATHVYRRDLLTNETKMVDVGPSGRSNQSALEPAMSADGRYVAFVSTATNLVPPGGALEVYVSDMGAQTPTVALASSSSSGVPANPNAQVPAVSSNGRYVLFLSFDPNLVGGDTNGVGDVFVKDLGTGTTARVSLGPSGGQLSTGGSYATINADARYIAFFSSESNLIPGVTGAQIYLRYTPNPSVDFEQQLGPCQIGRAVFVHAVNPCYMQAEPVNTATGNYYTGTTDARLPGIGIPFALARSYNSVDTTVGSMGQGWTHSYELFLTFPWNGDAVLHAEDGKRVKFIRQPNGSFVGNPGVRDSLALQGDGTYKLTRHDQVVYRFDAAGKLTSLRDRNNQGLTFAYTGGNLSTITDSAGRAITLTYANNRLSQLAIPGGRTVSYGYTNGLLTTVTDLRGGTTSYTYDASSRLKTITDQNNHVVVDNTYGSDGRVTQQIDGRGNASTFSWDPLTQTSTFTDARGKVWKDVYSDGVLVKQIDPLGNTTTYGYDVDLNQTVVTDARGNVTTYTFDSSGNPLTRTDPAPLSYLTTSTYDAQNNLKTVTDPRSNTTTYDYDPAGNLIKITQPGTPAVITQFGRDPEGTGLLFSTTDPNSKTTTFTYDSSANLTSITDPLGNKTTMGYDTSGRMSSRVDPRGNAAGGNPADYTWGFTYDNADHLATQTDPLANVTTFTYDPVGNVKTRKDANN